MAAGSVDTALAGRRSLPRAGERFGRFTVLAYLGRGGMGIVFSAYDPDLDRRVAVKLVRASADPAKTSAERERLMREARAMARLRHPNVLTVYEVGQDDGRVYLAMEQVEGGTLRSVQDQLRRQQGAGAWRTIVELYLAAGRGLAAAHRKGIVHRDFKPDNALVDSEGRVRVGDFGLASESENDGRRRTARGTEPSKLPPGAGTVFGTPAYMAAEQHLDGSVDARADQFAFCVALWEALYGQLPFPGDDHRSYAQAVLREQIREPRNQRGIPGWIRDTLRRGLSRDPSLRFADMDELLASLSDEPASQRRSRWIAMSSLVGLFAILAGYSFPVPADYGLWRIAGSVAVVSVGLVLGWMISRRSGSLSLLRGRVLACLVTPLLLSLVAVVGAAMLGLDPLDTRMVMLLLWSSMAAMVAAALGVWLWLAALAYLAAFVIAYFMPGYIHFAMAAGHLVLILNAFAIWGRPLPQPS